MLNGLLTRWRRAPAPPDAPSLGDGDRIGLAARLADAVGDPAADFRPDQLAAIARLAAGGRLLLVQRTGWGKSLVYFLATALLRSRGRGPTLLVSPLLSLMRDQVRAAERAGLVARSLDSTNRGQWPAIAAELAADRVDLLLISPERLGRAGFQALLGDLAPRIGLVAIDEAHCISDWGHDFRPDYRRLAALLTALAAGVPLIATTATANRRVIADVTASLGGLAVLRGPLGRDSLALGVEPRRDRAERLAWLAAAMPELSGSGIIYANSVAETERVAAWLQRCGVPAAAYHSRLDDADRRRLEAALLGGSIPCLVATTALGMGFDKPDLAYVFHHQAPPSLVQLYQQVGRAGRALPRAVAVLAPGDEDAATAAHFRRRRPDRGSAAVPAGLSPAADISALERRRRAEWAAVEAYAASRRHCLMRRLLRALDAPDRARCGRCQGCTGEPPLRIAPAPRTVAAARRFLGG